MASEAQQQPPGRDDDLDSMDSDLVQITYLAPGTIEEQNDAREAYDDADKYSNPSGSDVTREESLFDAPEPQPAESNLGISRQRETRSIISPDIEIWAATIPVEDGGRDPDPDPDGPDASPEANAHSPSTPASAPEQVDGPAFLVNWITAPRNYQIEEMPGFLHFDIQNGRRVAIFEERTWREGFNRGLRRHIMKRARRDDDCDE